MQSRHVEKSHRETPRACSDSSLQTDDRGERHCNFSSTASSPKSLWKKTIANQNRKDSNLVAMKEERENTQKQDGDCRRRLRGVYDLF